MTQTTMQFLITVVVLDLVWALLFRPMLKGTHRNIDDGTFSIGMTWFRASWMLLMGLMGIHGLVERIHHEATGWKLIETTVSVLSWLPFGIITAYAALTYRPKQDQDKDSQK